MPKRTKKEMAARRKVDPDVLRAVAAVANLTGVHTWNLEAQAHRPLMGVNGTNCQEVLRVRTEMQRSDDGGPLLAVVTATQEVTTGGEKAATVTVQLVLVYELGDSAGEFTSEQLELFAEVNGVFNAWPYLRETLESTFLRLGLRSAPLPTWRAPSELPPRGEPLVYRRGG